VVTAAPPRQARGQRPPAPWSRLARLGPFRGPDESRPVTPAAARPPAHGSLRIPPPRRSAAIPVLIRLIAHTVVENEHFSTRLRDD